MKAVAALATVVLTFTLISASPREPKVRTPVLVELFTSEGCSSCPPADALLMSLLDKQPVEEAEIIAMGEHVDYWNYIGWTDRFSSPLYSQRQSGYAKSFGLDSVYTPQMVVDGAQELIGSERGPALLAIRMAAGRPKPLTVNLAREDQRLRISVAGLASLGEAEQGAVLLAVTEDNLESKVPKGENAGRVLRHAAVARSFTVVGEVGRGADKIFNAALELDASWKSQDLRAIVIVQERSSRRILGLGALPLRSTAAH
jgi:hypothetical protein